MKLTAHEEYGFRCLVQIGKRGPLTIPEISEAEGISASYTAKLLRMLRRGGFITSARGKVGGYSLARPAERYHRRRSPGGAGWKNVRKELLR